MRQPDGMLRSRGRTVRTGLIAVIGLATWWLRRSVQLLQRRLERSGKTLNRARRRRCESRRQATCSRHCPRLTDRFRTMTGIESSVTFGASGQLAEQIKQGAPFDVFLSANESFVRDLAVPG